MISLALVVSGIHDEKQKIVLMIQILITWKTLQCRVFRNLLILMDNNIAWEIHLEITSFGKEGLKSPDEFHDAEPLGYRFAKRVGAMDWEVEERHECCMYSLT